MMSLPGIYDVTVVISAVFAAGAVAYLIVSIRDFGAARLRVFGAGKGDCMALQLRRKTVLIYDTGLKASYERRKGTQGARGFRLALDQAKRGRRADGLEAPPIVIISHVDRDHIGGLQAWVEDVFARSNSWEQARSLAQSEVSEVWCNIPPQDQALRSLAGPDAPEPRGARETPWPDGFAELPIWEGPLSGFEPRKENASEYPPDEVADWLEARQHLIQALYGNPDDVDWNVRGALERSGEAVTRYQENDLRLWLTQAFPRQRELFSEDRASTQIDIQTPEPEVPSSELRGRLVLRLWVRLTASPGPMFWLRGPDIDLDIDLWGPRTSVRIRREFHTSPQNLTPVTRDLLRTLSSGRHPHRLTLRLDLRGQAMLGDESGDRERVEELLHQMTGSRSCIDALTSCISFFESQTDLTDDMQEKLAIAKVLLGIAPLEGVSGRMRLFRALGLLGIPVVGNTESGYLGAGSSSVPELGGMDYEFVSPGLAELAKVQENWTRYRERLQVEPPSFAAAFLCSMACAPDVRWRADTSITNLSSLALWIRRVRGRSSLFLTGDALHGSVMDETLRIRRTRRISPDLRTYYQIPHHGGGRNTRIAGDDPDQLPGDVLHGGKKISAAFATGGMDYMTTQKGEQGPRQSVLKFFERGAKRTLAVNELLRLRDRTYYDVSL